MWARYWNTKAWYHRYQVQGLSTVLEAPSSLIVGYHGRPVAYDLFMLSAQIFEQQSYLPHAFVHGTLLKMPLVRQFFRGVGALSPTDDHIEAAIADRQHFLTAPGGTREGFRSFRARNRVDWGQRRGYLRFARKYGLPIIPVGASGVDDLYFGLVDGYALAKKLAVPQGVPIWCGLGPFGPWPLSLPWPSRIVQLVGRPVQVSKTATDNDLEDLHHEISNAVQELIDKAEGLRCRN